MSLKEAIREKALELGFEDAGFTGAEPLDLYIQEIESRPPEMYLEGIREDRKALTNWILSAPNDSILSVTQTPIPEHAPAKIRKSMPCAFYGEKVMESRIQQLQKKPACIPCYEKRSNFNQNDQAGIDNLCF